MKKIVHLTYLMCAQNVYLINMFKKENAYHSGEKVPFYTLET